jgi:hypothetical protein
MFFMSNSTTAEQSFDFHLEEFRRLKDDISQNHRIHLQIEIFTLTATGLIASLIISNQAVIAAPGMSFIWWSPLFVLYFGFIWSRSYVQRSFEIGQYLLKLEKQFGLSQLGWEHTHAPLRAARGGRISYPKLLLWVGLFGFFSVLALKFGSGPIWQALPR